MRIAKQPRRLADLPVGACYVPDGAAAILDNVYRKIDATRARRFDRRLRAFVFVGGRLVREVRGATPTRKPSDSSVHTWGGPVPAPLPGARCPGDWPAE